MKILSTASKGSLLALGVSLVAGAGNQLLEAIQGVTEIDIVTNLGIFIGGVLLLMGTIYWMEKQATDQTIEKLGA